MTETARPGGIRTETEAAPEGLHGRQYELLFEMTTQLLATPRVDEQLLLALDAATSDLGFAAAAIALIDEQQEVLRVRMAVGFPNDAALQSLEMPLDSGAPQVSVVYDGRPQWITRAEGEIASAFLEQLGCESCLLALPLYGGQSSLDKLPGDFARRPTRADRYWTPEAMCMGALYITAEESTLSAERMQLLLRFAERIGLIISSALQTERLVTTIAKLQRERQWVESIMKSVADPIVLTNLDNEILLQNRRAEELFSGSESASEGKRRALEMNDLLFSAYLSSAAFSGTEIVGRDLTLVDPLEGSDIHFEVISTPALNARGERIGLVSVFRDVTDLRAANEELARNFVKLQHAEAEARRERDRLDLIIENVGHPVVVSDASGNFLRFNSRAEALFQRAEAADQRADAAVRNNSVKLTSFISTIISDAATSNRRAEIELLDPATGVTLPMEISSGEVLDAKGEMTAVVSILHDLSEIRELERRRVERQLFESEKLAAIGRLAASIAHEVNNPLEAIKNSLYLMETSRDEAATSRFLEVARKETERVSHIIRQMLGFARRSGDVEQVNVNQILEETLILIDKKLRQTGIGVKRELDPELPPVRTRADQLRQVFLNLILNAQQAIEGKGEISIRTRRYPQALLPSIAVEISDTGRGIEGEDIQRIFEPFFSTRKRGGTGLGLWVTQDIVRHHGGRIEVLSEPDKGTTFLIILPLDSLTLEDDTKR